MFNSLKKKKLEEQQRMMPQGQPADQLVCARFLGAPDLTRPQVPAALAAGPPPEEDPLPLPPPSTIDFSACIL